MVALNDEPLIRGDGTPEAIWLAWDGLKDAPRLPLDAWLHQTARLVVVAPHPDDEVLACGGLLSLHAARGGAVRVIAVTDGEASHPGSAQWTPERLASARRAESAQGLRQLDANDPAQTPTVTRLGLPDGGVARCVDQLTACLKELLRPDDTVVCTWRHDGHPDHEASGRATAQACDRVGIRLIEAPVWMWHWAEPGDRRVPWHRLRALSLPASTLQRKRAALNAHLTQLSARDTGDGPVVSETTASRAARAIECFFVWSAHGVPGSA